MSVASGHGVATAAIRNASAPLSMKPFRSRFVERSYGVGVPETQRYMAERMKAKIKVHAVDHTPSVTAPGAVAEIIRDAIRYVTGN